MFRFDYNRKRNFSLYIFNPTYSTNNNNLYTLKTIQSHSHTSHYRHHHQHHCQNIIIIEESVEWEREGRKSKWLRMLANVYVKNRNMCFSICFVFTHT